MSKQQKTAHRSHSKFSRLTFRATGQASGHRTKYSYDAAGNLSHTTNPNASTVRYAFDPANRLIGLTNSAPNGTPISSYRYTLDAVGNHSQVSQVEPLETTPVAGQFSYSYDVDNRLTSAEGEPHAHDANGNMTGLNATNLLTYDFEDRLIKTVFAGATNEYQYDGAGNRKMAVRSGVTTRYVLDLNSSLSQVFAETDGSGNVTAYYVYGLGLISQIKPDGTALYYHFDSRGSTIAMTDAQGVVVNAYSYDPFGRTRDALEFSENRFRYLGRHGIVDEGNGFSYIRARYYSVRRGRFITKDPLTGTDGDPQSLNRYIYALNNPVRLIDISGLSPKDAATATRNYATSDTSPLHNYLISPATGGLSTDSGGSKASASRSEDQVASVASFGAGLWKGVKAVGKFVFENASDLYKLTSGGAKGVGVDGRISPVSAVTGMGIQVLEASPELLENQIKVSEAVKQQRSDYIETYKAVGYTYEEAWDAFKHHFGNVWGPPNEEKFRQEWDRTP